MHAIQIFFPFMQTEIQSSETGDREELGKRKLRPQVQPDSGEPKTAASLLTKRISSTITHIADNATKANTLRLLMDFCTDPTSRFQVHHFLSLT
jgi:hypothetical protein